MNATPTWPRHTEPTARTEHKANNGRDDYSATCNTCKDSTETEKKTKKTIDC
jgi:hypothetical protein